MMLINSDIPAGRQSVNIFIHVFLVWLVVWFTLPGLSLITKNCQVRFLSSRTYKDRYGMCVFNHSMTHGLISQQKTSIIVICVSNLRNKKLTPSLLVLIKLPTIHVFQIDRPSYTDQVRTPFYPYFLIKNEKQAFFIL